MDDTMIDLVPGDTLLRGRLEAYVEARLTPSLATSSRVRARVLAVAHRHADLARADAALKIVPAAIAQAGRFTTAYGVVGAHPPRPARHRTVTALLAASLMIGVATGTALAARPGGALYETRLWVETLTLPADPAARAIAELRRLETRLVEADAAARADDLAAAEAALAAYGRIMDQASAAAIEAQDEVAVAVLETGGGRNLDVLRTLIERVPTRAKATDTLEIPGPDRPVRRGGGTAPVESTPAPTTTPTVQPTTPSVTEPTDRPRRPDPAPRRTPAQD